MGTFLDMKRIEELFLETRALLRQHIHECTEEIKGNTSIQEIESPRTNITEQKKKIKVVEKDVGKNKMENKGITEEKVEKMDELIKPKEIAINTKFELGKNIVRIGRYVKGMSRPKMTKILRGKIKSRILHETKKLKFSKIWIDEEFSKELQEKKKQLLPAIKKARKIRKANRRFNNKLITDKEKYVSYDIEKEERASTTVGKRTVIKEMAQAADRFDNRSKTRKILKRKK